MSLTWQRVQLRPEPGGRALRRRAKRRWQRLFLAFGGLAAAVVVGEVGLRAARFDPLPDVIGPRYLFQRDPELGIALRPGFRGVHRAFEFGVDVEINSIGLREREPDPGPPGTLRVLVLGDSFAYGFGVTAEQTFARQLEVGLRERRAIRVDNAGAPSYGTRTELGLMRRVAPRLQPDLVLVAFFFANDLSDNVAPRMTERGGVVMSESFAPIIDSSPLRSFAIEHSNLLTLLLLRWMEVRYGLQLPPKPSLPPSDPEAVIESTAGLDVLMREPSAEVREQWRVAEALLSELAAEASSSGARTVLIHVPLLFQLDDEIWGRVLRRHGLDEQDMERHASARELASIAERLGVPCLDLSEAFAGEGDVRSLYFAFNKHLSPRGHLVAARALQTFLASRGLLGE